MLGPSDKVLFKVTEERIEQAHHFSSVLAHVAFSFSDKLEIGMIDTDMQAWLVHVQSVQPATINLNQSEQQI